jgi:(p)ppGpp synthase/HD superfamily hydrolase
VFDLQAGSADNLGGVDFDLIERAFLFAVGQHRHDVRKGSEVPYISHLLGVASLVLEAGGDDVQTAAAFLHDVAEDHGGERMVAELERRFGVEVASIVRDLSDSLVDTTTGARKEDWELRKRRYVAHLAEAPDRSLLVAAADKLHNARSVVADYRELGDALWDRFNEKEPYKHLWYYRSLADLFERRLVTMRASRLVNELTRTVDELEALIKR